MSSVSISLTADNAALKASLRGLMALHASGYARTKNDIGVYMVAQIKDRLEQQKLWDGKAMLLSKAAAKRSGKTLLDQGHLRDSYHYAVTGKGVELRAGGHTAGYAAIHHFGGMAGRGRKVRIDARPVLGVSPDNLKNIGSLLVQAITAHVGARGI